MNCLRVGSLLSTYLDGALEVSKARLVDAHLGTCDKCTAQLAGLKQTRTMLLSVGRKPAPGDLALKIKLAVSREAAILNQGPFSMVRFRLENALNAFMVPATAGLLSAIVFFGLLIGFFAIPSLNNDVPVQTMLYTPPELAMAPFGLSSSVSTDSVVLEAVVDPNGRVQDYRVLSSPDGVGMIDQQLKNMLIFTIFRPATSFGRPTTGRVILSFSHINVKG
ncbi:MAG TPA: zf-HC2 domain-containing protein [Terriglobales bacterium]|nr:zf-HC2 domain-containing protein [Terriglobales bacterium]